MKLILDTPLAVRVAIVFVLGIGIGSLVHLAIHGLGFPRGSGDRSSTAPTSDARRRWLDCLPVLGWWRLSRRSAELGPGVWIRPLVLQVLCAVLFAGLYWWEIGEHGLVVPPSLPPNEQGIRVAVPPSIGTWTILHVVLAAHVLLVSLMLVASVIDLDERVIPDAVTVPGTLAGLALAAMIPTWYCWTLLPGEVTLRPPGIQFVRPVTVVFPEPWPVFLEGFPQGLSLFLALACYWSWCAALLPRLWLGRRGFDKAVRMFVAHAMRSPGWPTVVAMAVYGGAAIGLVWWLGGANWVTLFTSLVGLAAGGGLVWGVRIAAGWALGREAMGFGDVTLMAMIGSFVGWQASVMVFFLAPFAALAVGLARLALGREREIPYGPFLCLAALGVIVFWVPLWGWAEPRVSEGSLVLAVLAACLVLLGLVLALWRLVSAWLTKPA